MPAKGSTTKPPAIGGGRSVLYAALYRDWIIDWSRRRPFVAMFVAGAISTLAMAPTHIWLILFLTLPALFWALDDVATNAVNVAPWRRAAWRGWAFGFGYFFAGLYWIGFSFLVQAEKFAALMPFAVLGLTAALGLFFAVAAIAFAWARQHLPEGFPRILALALAIMATEWLRGHILTGFPWNILGYALTMPLAMMQWAGLFGIYVLTAITVITLTTPLIALAGTSSSSATAATTQTWRTIILATIAPLGLALLYGWWQLEAHPTAFDEKIRLRVVQPSFTQKEKFDVSKRGPIFYRHLEMSRQGFDAGADSSKLPTHIIWPEAAIPFFVRRDRRALAAIDHALPDHVQVIAGTFRTNVSPDTPSDKIGTNYRVFNSTIVFGGDGRVNATYDKIHLVPFGEYLPAQDILNALGFENLTRAKGGLAAGTGPRRPMHVSGLPPVSMLICYEASFPDEVIQSGERPGLLINLTNDAWFGATSGPYQHLHQTRLRAVEQGLAMIRSANNGISAIVDPMGRIVRQLGLNRVGVVDSPMPTPQAAPIYARHGMRVEIAITLLLLAGLLGSAIEFRRRGRQ